VGCGDHDGPDGRESLAGTVALAAAGDEAAFARIIRAHHESLRFENP
jgi:hypothetical protein